jgi:hypothetical protein
LCAIVAPVIGACSAGGRIAGDGGLVDMAMHGEGGSTDFALASFDGGQAIERFYAHDANTLYLVDPDTFVLTTIGNFGTTQSMTDLAVNAAGEVYTVSKDSLYSVNATTGKATLVVSGIADNNVALTFTDDGRLLASDKSGTLRELDPTTGHATTLGTYGSGFNTAGDLVVVADGTMFGISETGPGTTSISNALLKVSSMTGTATGVGPIGYKGVFGIAFSRGKVIAFTDGGDIIQIDPATGQGTLKKSTGKAFFGAGSNPLQPIN